MPISRRKSPSELYDDVADADLVIVPDPPLASALNRQLDRPHLGQFAITPRRLAAKRRETAEDRLAFLELINEADIDWKGGAETIGDILQCWEYQTSLESILEYPRYADAITREAVDIVADLDTTSKRLTEFELGEEIDVIVAGPDQLTPLEQSILPADFESTSLFTDEAVPIPTVDVFPSKQAIVQSLINTIDTENAESIGIVLDQESTYSPLVESALDAADIPFIGGPGFLDRSSVRSFLRLLRTSFTGADTRVADVQPVLHRLGADVSVTHAEKRLVDLDVPETEWLAEFCALTPERTFETALDAYEARTATQLDDLRAELDALGLATTSISLDAIDDLEFYLQTYEVPIDREDSGVLLADAKSTGHVDRPVVFYLGLDENWTHTAPRRPWVDTEAEYARNIGQFQRLLQNGVEQHYLVQASESGQAVTPTLYFSELLEESLDRFDEFPHQTYGEQRTAESAGFEHEPFDATAAPLTTVSQSSLNTYVNCPRDYLFSRLVDTPDKDYFKEGNLFHDFAEYYVSHPEAVDEAALERVVDLMVEETAPFIRHVERPIRRTKYRVGLETIMAYLDANPPSTTDTSGSPSRRNAIATHFETPITATCTEEWFEDEELGVKGLIDLVRSPTALVDYKSGSKKRASKVVKNAAIDPPGDTPNFQAPLYLAYQRRRQPDSPISFTFVHFLETLDDAITDNVELEDTQTTITYYPMSFEEYVATEDAYEKLCSYYNDCTGTFEALGYETYQAIQSELSFPAEMDRDDARESTYAEVFTAAVEGELGDTVGVDIEKGCDQAIRRFYGVRRRNFFETELDALESFIDEQRAAMNTQRRGDERFPVEGVGGEPNYRWVDHRDLILEGGQ